MTLLELIEARKCEYTCEVGCLYGKTSARILDISCVESHTLIDPWLPYSEIGQGKSDDKRLLGYQKEDWDRIYTACCNKMKVYGDRVNIIRKTSFEAAKDIENFSMDCVVIDSDHTRKSYAIDAVAWLPKVRNGGIFVSHDYSSGWKQIVKVTDDIFKEIIRLEGGYAYIEIDCAKRIESIVRANKIKNEVV